MPKAEPVNITMPPELREAMERVLASRGYGSVSEYVRDLVRRDLARFDREALDRRLLAAIEEPATELRPGELNEAVERVIRRRAGG